MSKEPELVICNNCVNYHSEVYNMVGMINAYCKKGVKEVTYKRNADATKCIHFLPTLRSSNTFFLKELYENYISEKSMFFSKNMAHYWRIDMRYERNKKQKHRRISGDRRYFMRFDTEENLIEFYNRHIDLLSNCNCSGLRESKINVI